MQAQEARVEPDYIQAQRERLRVLKQREAEIAAGKSVGGDGMASWMFTLGVGTFVVGTFGSIGYLIWQNSVVKADSLKFLEEKEKEEGVIKLPSGLMYKVLSCGEGRHHPTLRTGCSVNYRGTLVNGTEFDSSYVGGRPVVLTPSKLIRGWAEALQLMVEGDNWELYIPAGLAYGNDTTGKIPGNSALTFQVELVQMQGDRVPKKDS